MDAAARTRLAGMGGELMPSPTILERTSALPSVDLSRYLRAYFWEQPSGGQRRVCLDLRLHNSVLSLWTRGVRMVPGYRLPALAESLDVPLAELLAERAAPPAAPERVRRCARGCGRRVFDLSKCCVVCYAPGSLRAAAILAQEAQERASPTQSGALSYQEQERLRSLPLGERFSVGTGVAATHETSTARGRLDPVLVAPAQTTAARTCAELGFRPVRRTVWVCLLCGRTPEQPQPRRRCPTCGGALVAEMDMS